MLVLIPILGLAVLMVVHEGGHMLVARAFGMRVVRFSIGFGPTLWRYQPKGSETIYQVGVIPFIAYVQIAGMNPFEENDPDDKSSYANASVLARIATIFAGPAANYIAASVILFIALMLGKPIYDTKIKVQPDSPAAAAGMQTGDRIVKANGEQVGNFEDLRDQVIGRAEKKTSVVVDRGGKEVALTVVPRPHVNEKTKKKEGLIGVQLVPSRYEARDPLKALEMAVVAPALQVQASVIGLSRLIFGKESPKLSGPVGIGKVTYKALQNSFQEFLLTVAGISTALAFFNMLPFPALDGGRLVFLGYEAITRRRPDQRVETQIHIVGLLLLLSLIFVVSYKEVLGLFQG